MDEMGLAFQLLGIGLVTVFAVLAIVVVLGNLIIRFVNKFVPETEKVSSSAMQGTATQANPKTIAAIVSAVSKVTNGSGRVVKIERL